MDSLEIRYAREQDISDIIKISNRELGENYFSEVTEKLTGTTEILLRIAATERDQVVAFCYSRFMKLPALKKELNLKKIPVSLPPKHPVGLMKTIAVQNEYKNMGIGTRLITDTINIMQEQKITSFFLLAWKSRKSINVLGIMKYFRFSIILTIPGYWYNESLEKGYSCPVCGSPPCCCEAALFYKNTRG